MRVDIPGSGLMGGKLGTIFARAGYDVVFSYAPQQRETEEAHAGRTVSGAGGYLGSVRI